MGTICLLLFFTVACEKQKALETVPDDKKNESKKSNKKKDKTKKKNSSDSQDSSKENKATKEAAKEPKSSSRGDGVGPEMLSQIFDDLEKIEKQECPEGTVQFALAEQSEVMWRSIKNEELPVVGFNQLRGNISSSASDPSVFELNVTMLPETTFSSDALRDSRIIEYFFAEVPIQFKANSISLEEFHEVGQTRIAEIPGTLSVGGYEKELTITTDYTVTTYGIMLRTLQSVSLSIENDLNLGDNLEALLALVEGVTVEDDVSFSFTVHFLDVCE